MMEAALLVARDDFTRLENEAEARRREQTNVQKHSSRRRL